MNPVVAPHHLEKGQVSKWREGAVVCQKEEELSAFVNVGLERDILIDRKLPPGTRVTVKMNNPGSNKRQSGVAVSPSAPRTEDGLYWGYSVRMAQNLPEVWSGCEYEAGYDYVIGTSENGDNSLDDSDYSIPDFKVFSLVCFHVFWFLHSISICSLSLVE